MNFRILNNDKKYYPDKSNHQKFVPKDTMLPSSTKLDKLQKNRNNLI